MNQQIITTSSMIKNRNTQHEQSYIPSSQVRKHNRVRTLQTFLTALTMLFALGVNGAWAEVVTATWDFQSTTAVNYQGAAGYVNSNVEGIVLYVDATNSGKLATNGLGGTSNHYAQFNKNTIIRVPVVAVGDEVTVISYSGQYNYTVGGTAASANTTTYTAVAKDVTAKYVDIIATSTAYLYSISVVQHEPSDIPEWERIELSLNAEGLLLKDELVQGKDVDFGISLDNEGNVIRVEKGASNAIGSITGKYHSDHGMNPFSMTLNVPGPVKITSGTCTYGTVQVKVNETAVGDAAVGDGKTNTCWKSNPSNIATGIYTGEAGEITITVGSYCPYIKIEKYEAPAVPDYTVTFSNTTEGVAGTVPTAVTKAENETMTIPANYTLYKEGYTLTGWSDGVNTYKAGDTYTFTKDETLTAVFTKNTKTLEDRTEPVTLKWDFQTKNGAPTFNLGTNKTGFYVSQTTIDDEVLDVKMDFDTKTGKLANASWTDWCQLNGGFEFYLPSCEGAEVSMETYSVSTETTIDGVALEGNTSKTPSHTVTSSNNPITVVYGGDASYFRWIKITLPVPTAPAEKFDVSAELAAQKTPDGWTAVQLPDITLNKIITLDGLVEGSDNATTIQAAIDAVSTAGGGKVIIPPGTWLSGPLEIKSNVVLHLSANTKLMMLPIGTYPHVKEKYFIGTGSASVENVVIEGEGDTSILDGQGEDWWQAYEEKTLTGERPGALVRFAKGSKFLVRYIKFQNAPNTNLTLGNSGNASNFTVHDVTIVNPSSIEREATADGFAYKSHNTDGIPVWGPYVNIYNCTIDTGDDNVVFDSDSRYGHVWNCTFKRGHGASIGSFTERLHHIIFEGITFDGTAQGFRLKTNRTGRSGNGENSVHDIICRNSTMTGVADPFIITSWYDYGSNDNPLPTPSEATAQSVVSTTPEFKDILFQNIEVTNPGTGYSGSNHQYPIYIYGLPEMTIKNVTFDNVQIDGNKGMFMAYCEGVNFTNGCKVTNVKTPSSFIELEHEATITGDYGQIPPFKEFEVVMASGKTGNVITEAAGTNNIEFGIAVDNEGNVSRVAAGASNSIATIRGNYNGQHGLTNFTCITTVPGAVKITVGTCSYDSNAYLKVGSSNIAGPFTGDKSSNCWKNNASNTMYGIYRGDAGEITIEKGGYTPYIKVELFDAEAEPEEDPTGVYDAIVSNVKQLKSALSHSGTASKQYKIFVQNGEYDLGTDYNTAVSNYVTVIGESRDGVVIKNKPVTEGLKTSATFQVASNVILENLTLQCTVDYNSTTNAERGTALYDNGANNTYRNIRLLGRQDTYYSDNNASSYFENCEIHGTVDFICGGGNVWFEKCQILLENRTSGTNVIAAPTTAVGKSGYVFNNCTIDNAEGANMAGKYYLARAWQNEPRCTFNKTTKNIAYKGPWDASMGVAEDKIHFTEDADNEATGSKPVEVTVLAAPANVALTGTTLSWNAVADAVAYIVYNNGTYLATTTETSYDVSTSRSRAVPEYSVAALSALGVIGEEGEATAKKELVEISESTTWDWSKVTVNTASVLYVEKNKGITLTDETTPTKSEELVMSTYAPNHLTFASDFNADAISFMGQYPSRNGYAQAGVLHFRTTVPGKIKVEFSDTGSSVSASAFKRYLNVNGANTEWWTSRPTSGETKTNDKKTTDDIAVPAGDVYIKAMKEDGETSTDVCYYKVIFTADASDPSGDGTEGSITWAVGNESAGTVSSEIADAVSRTKVTVGSDLAASTYTETVAEGGNVLASYRPSTSNAGAVPADMIEYTVQMKKGITFTPTNVTFDAIKQGTDGAFFKWSYTVDGVESDKQEVAAGGIHRNTKTDNVEITHENNITTSGGQKVTIRFYISGVANNKDMAIGNIKINGIVSGTEIPRTFQNFKIDFRSDPYTVILPDNHTLPDGVTVNGTFHDAQHGYNQSTITIPVDGPVKLTFGSCNYGSPKATIVDASGKSVTVDTNNGCDSNTSFEHFVTWTYNNETPTTLTVTTPGFIPFFYAEACEYIPTVDVTYYDTDGTKVISKETVEGSSALAYAYGESNVTVPDGSKFRGWFDRKLTNLAAYNGKKVAEGTVLNEDLKLYAIATPIEVATPDSRFTYDLTKDCFYQEDHEGITIDKGKYYNTHGWLFENDGTIKVPVSGNADLTFTICCYTSEQTFTITDEKGTEVGTILFVPEKDGAGNAKESAPYDISYVGPATTLTFTLPKGGYIHEVEVYNKPIPESDLAIVAGKDVITLNPGSTYQLTKGEENDYTTSSEAAMTYESDNTEMVTVSETGLLTAGTGFGQATITMTQAGNDKFQTGSVSFTVKVVSAHGQTAKPTATVGEDGKVYLTGNILDSEAKIYYTTNGDEPTTASTEYNGEAFIVSAGTIVKAIAIHDDKSPSDIVTAYYKIPATLTWDWNSTTAYSVKPRYSNDDLKELFDNNTQANIGNNLEYKGTSSDVKGKDYKFTKFQLAASLPKGDKNSAIQFNVLTKAGLYFKPTATSATVTRGGTNTTANVDISIADETTEKFLGEGLTPNRYDGSGTSTDGGATGYNTYSYDASNFTDMAMTSDLSMYIYTHSVAKDYYYADITIDGLVSGSLYDGEFYNVGYDVEPAEGGYVVQKPSVSSVMAGKTVVFNATPTEGYKFINWTKAADGTVLSTDKIFNRTITEDTYIKANFQKIPLVTFSKEGLTDIDGNVPAAQYVDADTYELSIPANYVLYKEGSTMIGWAAGDKTYRLGESHRFDADVTLKPKFQRNEVAITDINEKVTVRWDFNHRERPENSPELNVYTNDEQTEKSTGIYTRTATVNGVPVDMKMSISAPSGNTKLDNRDMTVPVTAAQVNPGTKVTIPAVPGMKVILKASEDKDTRDISGRTKPRHTQFIAGTTIPSYFGDDPNANHPTRVDDYTAEYIYNGNDKAVTLTFQQIAGQGDWGFYEWIEVEYPVLQDVKLFNSITDKLDREKNENAGTLEITAKDPEHANTGKRYLAGDVVTISATAKYGYTITGFKHNETLLEEGLTIADGGKSATVSYTVVDGDNTVYAVYERQTTYPVRVTTADLSLGEVTLDPIYENFLVRGKDYIEGHYVTGTEVKLKSEAGEGNVLSYWMDGAESWKDGEGNPNQHNPNVDITVGTDAAFYTAYFRPGEKGTVIFDMTGSGVYAVSDPNTYSGSVSMNPATLSGVRSFNVPTNFTFFKPGYTLEHWKVKDSDATYELGQRGSFTEEGQTITLVPVFRQNNATQENRTNNPVIRYDFGSGIFNYDDPTKGETRKVSAQKVNIPKNTKTFWTSKVWTEVLVDGNPDKNWRDVAMWVNTGEKGFVRNGDLPDWAAFGPGTTFEVASGSGTKFSLMTYAPITTTTIDGVVPELDEARSNPANHEYVYTYTTRSAEDRVKIVIGNDYSYYKWLEAATLAANMVDLHIKTTDNVVGEVTSVKSWDEENYPSKDLDDGGHSFQKGNKVVVTFYRKFGAEFKQIVDPAKNDLPILEMLDNGKVRMVRLGDGTDLEEVASNGDGTWGGGNDHVFKLTKSAVDDTEKAKGFLTKYVVEFEITNHRNLEIQFKEKPTYYVTYNTGTEAVGVAPSAAWVEAGDYYKISKNQTLYYEGHTLDHWVDLSGKVYNIGQNYQMSPDNPRDMLLYPVFRQNTFSLLDLTAEATATWELGRGNGAPVISYQRINGIYIAQVSNGESDIDVKLDLMGVNGKIDNKSYEERAQINEKSAFFFPVTEGCVVSLASSSPSNQIETTKIFRKDAAAGGYEKGQIVTATYSGVAGQDSVVFANDGKYYTQFSITYKAQEQTAQPALTSVKYGETTLTADQFTALTTNGNITLTIDPDVNTNRVPAITAVVENGKAEIEQATYQNPVATVTLKTQGGMSIKAYAINFDFSVPATAPKLSSVKVKNATVTDYVANNAPVSGSIEITFDRIMKAASVTPASPGESLQAISAPQGKTLTFNYWNLPVNKDVTITIPANTLEDVYGKKYAEPITLTLHTAATNMAIEHKPFDYVVGHGDVSDINAIIKAVNANRETGRLRIFIPDGEYELTGNEKSSWKAGDETTDDNGVSKKIEAGGFKYDNHMTVISRTNVSLIGQSQENTILYNRPKYEGIGCTATIHVTGVDDYLEDLTLENRFPYYKANFAGRAVAFWDQGNRQVLKNVSLLSYQDTYYSHGNGNYRGYFEDCVLAGTVDWLCGNGDIWLERCGIMIRNRNGNNIAAPATMTPWGYVFNNCRIYPEEGADLVTDKSYTLGRPWQGTPSATYLNTTFDVLPRDEGWQAMMESHVLKFHEYGSMDSYGHPISLGSRTLAGAAPLKGSDDLILTEEAASKYTIENVLGGGEAFDPRIYTQQIDAVSGGEKDANNTLAWDDQIEIDDDRLQWRTEPMALCYFVFKLNEETGKWEYKTNIAQSTEDETMTGLSLEPYGNGFYCVRAANQRGGLGTPTEMIEYTVSEKYTLTIKEVGNTPGYGWSTICLPYNSKVPTVNAGGEAKDLKIYAANGDDSFNKEEIVDNYTLYLTPVDVINKNMGYVVYGPVGDYTFSSSSHTSDVVTILSGNPKVEPIPVGNNNSYVLANKTTYGLGFYKFTGATLAANRAWLPVDMVETGTQTGVNTQAKAITFFFVDYDAPTGLYDNIVTEEAPAEVIYDTTGRRIGRQHMRHGGIYIINGQTIRYE